MNQYTPLAERFAKQYVVAGDCWLWTGASSPIKNERRPTIRVDGRTVRAYRVAFELFIGPIPAGAYICHHCDNPMCVNPKHLYAGDAKTNAQDAMRRGRATALRYPDETRERARVLGLRNTWSRGRHRRSAVIPHADLGLIQSRLASGVSLASVASDYGVSKQAVRQMVRRNSREGHC